MTQLAPKLPLPRSLEKERERERRPQQKENGAPEEEITDKLSYFRGRFWWTDAVLEG